MSTIVTSNHISIEINGMSTIVTSNPISIEINGMSTIVKQVILYLLK